jgi:hypothetical protein
MKGTPMGKEALSKEWRTCRHVTTARSVAMRGAQSASMVRLAVPG